MFILVILKVDYDLIDKEVITTKNSKLTCLRTGMTIEALTSGQDGIFAKQLQYMRKMELEYSGLRSILEDPYGSLYLNPEMRDMALQFLSDKLQENGGTLELITLYNPDNIEGMYIKSIIERLMVDCDGKSHEILVNDLLETAIENGIYSTDGWDERYLNAAMFDMIVKESDAYAEMVARGGLAKWSEENRMMTNWAAESAYAMAYGVMMYGHMESARGKGDGKKDWRTKAEKARAAAGGAEDGNGPRQINIKTIKENPQQLWGKSPEEIAAAFRAQGYNVTVEQSTKGSGKAIIIRPDGGNINMVQIHSGGGRHGSAYIKISTDNGKLKLIGGSELDYVGNPYGERNTTVVWMED